MPDTQPLELTEKKVRDRWDQLANLATANTTDGLKHLGLIHLAGIGGTLSYMGAAKNANLCLGLSFTSFFLGVTFVAVTYLLRFFYFRELIEGWNSDCAQMFNGEIAMAEVQRRDKERTAGRVDWPLNSAIFSLILFFSGGIFGFIGLLSTIK